MKSIRSQVRDVAAPSGPSPPSASSLALPVRLRYLTHHIHGQALLPSRSGGISLTVPALRASASPGGWFPRPRHGPGIGVLMAALGTAVVGLLAPVSLRVKPAVWLIPASRFPGLLISGIAGAKLMHAQA
jgi:hypothetical protein